LGYLDRRAASGMSSLFQSLEGNTQARIYVLVAAGGLIGTVLLWVVHWSYPHVMLELLGNDSKALILFLFAVVAAPPFCLAYSLGSIISRRAGVPAHDEDSGPMSGYFYRERANKEWKLLMLAGICGGLNFLLMLITSSE